jgi:predicted SPOUT superfamily RNA methylase MTH1
MSHDQQRGYEVRGVNRLCKTKRKNSTNTAEVVIEEADSPKI